jgi:hypothetical protein
MILTFAAAPVIPLLVDHEVQTVDVEWTVGMLEPYFVLWLSCIWVQFSAPHFSAPVLKELWDDPEHVPSGMHHFRQFFP